MKLVIAEKPSVAAELAKVLGAAKKGNGFYTGKGCCVTWCVGHLVESVMPEAYDPRYEKWKIHDLPILPAQWKYEVTESTKGQFEIVKSLMDRQEVDELVCATDAGREGELIFRLVYMQAGCAKPFRRLWISSMENKAIKDGFANLRAGSDYDRLYDAAVSRMQADWLVGINFSRLFSCMSDQPQNVGRVQTPTINLIVERQRTIDNFDAKPYYVLTAACSHDGVDFSVTRRVESEAESAALLEKCHGKDGVAAQIQKTKMKENPPALYDLTTLQREANKMLGLSAQQTLDATQNLYEKKLVTYPRTDSRYLTADMKESTEQLIRRLLTAPWLNPATKETYDPGAASTERLINDKKVTDHHAIIPTVEALKGSDRLPVNEANILRMIAYKLLTAAYIPHEYVKTELTVEIEGEEFKTTGRMVTAAGFKEVASQLAPLLVKPQKKEGKNKGKGKGTKEEKEETLLPTLAEGDILHQPELSSEKKETKPPKPYTEDTLLSAMENAMKTLEDEELKKEVAGAGLGTPATRAGIIERIIKTGFIQRKGKNLLPTEKAYRIVDIVPEKVKSAVLTAEWEQKLEQIYQGKASRDEFMEGIRAFVTELVDGYKENFAENGKEIIGTCPRCGRRIFEGRTNYYCEADRDVCSFVIWKDEKFFASKKKPLTKPMVKALLKRGRIRCVNLYSERTGGTYEAYVRMVDTGQYVNFRLEFPERGGYRHGHAAGTGGGTESGEKRGVGSTANEQENSESSAAGGPARHGVLTDGSDGGGDGDVGGAVGNDGGMAGAAE